MLLWIAFSAVLFIGGLAVGWWANVIHLRRKNQPSKLPKNDALQDTPTASDHVLRQVAMLAAVRDALIVFDNTSEHRISHWNNAAETLYGYTSQEAIGQPIASLLKTESDVETLRQIRSTIGIGNAWQGGLIRYNKAGDQLYIEMTLSVMRDAQGHLQQMLEIDRDVTEHMHVKKTLILSEQRFRLLFETMQTGIVVLNSIGQVVLVNPAALRMFGLSDEQIRNKADIDPAWTALNEDGLPVPVEQHPLGQIFAARKTITEMIVGVYRPITQDRVWLLVSANPELDANGQVIQIVFANIDITQRILAQHALRDSQAGFKRLFANNPLPMWVYDQETLAFLDVNEAAVTHYGYSRHEFLNMTIVEIRLEADKARLRLDINEPRLAALSVASTWQHILKDGRIIDVEITSHVLEFSGRSAVLVVAQDVTDRKRAEHALRASEERFRVLTENGTDLICILDAEGNITYLSQSVERILGYTSESLYGQLSFDLVHPDDLPRLLQATSASFYDTPIEIRIRHRNGGWRCIEYLSRNLLDNPVINGIVVNARDITDRKVTEQALRASEVRLRTLIENSSDMTSIVDSDGITRYVSPSIERVLGYAKDELIGSKGLELIHPEDLPEVLKRFQQPMRPQSMVPLQYRARHKDGTWRHLEAVSFNASQIPGINGLIINAHDVTERWKAGEVIREANENLEALIRFAPMAIVALDEEGNVTRWNPAAEQLFGWLEQDVLRRPNPIIPHDDQLASQNALPYPNNGDQFQQIEVSRVHQDGTLIEVNLSTALLRDARGHIRGTISTMFDIRAVKQNERKLIQQNGYLRALYDTMLSLVNRVNADDFLETLLIRAGALMDTPDGFVYMVDSDQQTLTLRVGVGFYKKHIGLKVKYGDGMSGAVWKSGVSAVIEHYASWPGRLPHPDFDTITSLLGAPLKSGNQIVGVLGLARFDIGRSFTPDETALFNQFVALASVALDNVQLLKAAQQELDERKRAERTLLHQNEYLTALNETTLALVNRLDVTDLIETILTRAGTLIGAGNGFICLYDPPTDQMITRVTLGRFKLATGRVARDNGIAGRVCKSGQLLTLSDYAAWSERLDIPEFKDLHALVAAPLKSGDQTLGVLCLAQTNPERAFSADEVTIFSQFAELAAIAMDNARLYTSAQQELVERKYAEEELQQLNIQLEQRVNDRTVELQKGQEQLRAVLDAMDEGLIYSENMHISYANRAMAELTDYVAEDLIGLPNAIFKSARATSQQAYRFHNEAVQPGVTWRGETRWRRRDGTDFDAALTVRLVQQADDIHGMVTVVRDITSEKQLQTQKAEFIANASHELRTPLTNFKTRLYLLRRQMDRADEHMTVLERVTERMINLVEDLLDVSRFERGVIPLDRRDLILQDLIREVISTQQPDALLKAIQLTAELPSLPMHVRVDAGRITQVIVNLIVNAINYTREGGSVLVALSSTETHAVFRVRDTGIGISAENLTRVFEPFFRANEGTVRGTGLGLSISREIVILHGGTLVVESVIGEGSTFAVSLPFTEPFAAVDSPDHK